MFSETAKITFPSAMKWLKAATIQRVKLQEEMRKVDEDSPRYEAMKERLEDIKKRIVKCQNDLNGKPNKPYTIKSL